MYRQRRKIQNKRSQINARFIVYISIILTPNFDIFCQKPNQIFSNVYTPVRVYARVADERACEREHRIKKYM